MALTGIALVGYSVVHLIGNLTFYRDAEGAAFDAYAEALVENPLLPVAEIALALLFLVHIALGVRLSLANREARRQPLRVRASKGERTLGSSSMLVTGLVLLVFLVIHVWDFRAPRLFGHAEESLAAVVKQRLGEPLGASIYLLGVAALGVHVSHGFQSAFQTLGVNHPKLTPWLRKLGLALAVVLFVGFASFPLYCLAVA